LTYTGEKELAAVNICLSGSFWLFVCYCESVAMTILISDWY